ncbi:hypothetical protein EBZ57_01040 [bacterium]|nr:hypothetical protein [bacterium]
MPATISTIKLINNRKGFTHFETALAIIVVAVIAAAGLYVLNYNKNKSKADNSNYMSNSAVLYTKQIDSNSTAEIRACKYTSSSSVPSIIYFAAVKYSQKPAKPPVKFYYYDSTNEDEIDLFNNNFDLVTDNTDGSDSSMDYDNENTNPKLDLTFGYGMPANYKLTFIITDSNNQKLVTTPVNPGAVPECFADNYDFSSSDTTETTIATPTTPPATTTTTNSPAPTTAPTTTPTTPPTPTKKPPTPTKKPPTPTKKNGKPKIKVVSKKVRDNKTKAALDKAKKRKATKKTTVKPFYPHNFESFTRVIHTCCFEKNKVMNYDAWWTDASKKELVVQMRVYIPANSQYIPSKFRSAVFDGNRRLAYFRISDGVPANWYASPKATYAQVNNSKAPTGRYYGEAHIKAKDIKGDLLKFQTYYIAGAKSEPGISKDMWAKTVKINKSKLSADNPKSNWRRTELIADKPSTNTLLTYKVDKATISFTGCVNKQNKNKLDLTMTANVPANFNHILQSFQANYLDGSNKKITVLSSNKNLPEKAEASSLNTVNPPAGEYSGDTTINKVSVLNLNLFHNTTATAKAEKNAITATTLKNSGGLVASTSSLTATWPQCK